MKQETLEEVKDINYWKNNCEENYITTPISVLRYISELEKQQERSYTEEEVTQLLIKFNQEIQEVEDVREWLEQFKKK